MCLASLDLVPRLHLPVDALSLMVASASSSSPYPLNFIMIMGFFFVIFYVIARVLYVIPLIRYIPFLFWAVYLSTYPQVLLKWQELYFYPFWGSVLAYAQCYFKRYLRWRELNPRPVRTKSIGFNRNKQNATRRMLFPYSNEGRSKIAIFFAWLWRAVCNITYFTFIFMPVRLIRLGFWIKRMVPQLRTARGWWNLFTGLMQWIWHLLPFAIRYEFEKYKHGKDFTTAMGEEMMTSYQRGEKERRKREEEELRRAFSKAKRYFHREAKAGRNPFEEKRQQQQEQRSSSQQGSGSHSDQASSSEQSESDAFWDGTKKSTNSGREHQQSNQQSSQQKQRNAQSSHWSQSHGANSNTSSTRSNQQRSGNTQGSSKSQQGSQSTSQNSSQQTQSRSTYQHKARPQSHEERNKKDISRSTAKSPPLTKSERHILSKKYYDEHHADFIAAGWTYDPLESGLDTANNPLFNLGLSLSTPTAEAKKRYHKLSQKYRKWALPIYPSTVTDRANIIILILNDAGSYLRKRK